MTLEMQKTSSLSQNQVLFEKRTVAELSNHELVSIDGGSTPVCTTPTPYFVTIIAGAGSGANNSVASVTVTVLFPLIQNGLAVVGEFVGGVLRD